MDNCFSVDSTSPTSYKAIRDYLYKELKPIIKSKRAIIFICIGTDRSTGDSLGPLVGHKLKFLSRDNLYIYGSLESPIHSANLVTILNRIEENFDNPYIIGIDASLGSFQNIGKVFIEKKPLLPGLAVNKELPPVGEMSITGIVNISGKFEFMVLQNTRLYTVMTLSEAISKGIYHFILKSMGKTPKDSIEEIFSMPNN